MYVRTLILNEIVLSTPFSACVYTIVTISHNHLWRRDRDLDLTWADYNLWHCLIHFPLTRLSKLNRKGWMLSLDLMVAKRGETRFMLGKNLATLVFAWGKTDKQKSRSNFIMCKVEVDFNMHCTSLKNWIGHQISGFNVVKPQNWALRKSESMFLKIEAKLSWQ